MVFRNYRAFGLFKKDVVIAAGGYDHSTMGEDMELVVKNIAFDSIISSVDRGIADVGATGMSITEDRLQQVDFSNPYTTAKQVIIVREDLK